MILVVKILLLFTLGIIAFQDMKDRLVWWFLFPIYALLGGFLFFGSTYEMVFLYTIGTNLLIVTVLISIIYLYSRLIMRKKFLNESFGLGDILFLIAFAIGFPTVSFVVFLVFSLLFSVVIQMITRSLRKNPTAPLAGYIALFLIGIYSAGWLGMYPSIYLV